MFGINIDCCYFKSNVCSLNCLPSFHSTSSGGRKELGGVVAPGSTFHGYIYFMADYVWQHSYSPVLLSYQLLQRVMTISNFLSKINISDTVSVRNADKPNSWGGKLNSQLFVQPSC